MNVNGQGGIDMGLLALSERGTDRLKKLLLTYAVATTATNVVNRWYGKGRAKVTYTVSVPGDDELYTELHSWVLGQMGSRNRKAVLARTGRSSNEPALEDSSTPAVKRTRQLQVFYDGSAVQKVTIGGHRVHVHVQRPDKDKTLVVNGDSMPRWLQALERIVFTCYSTQARDAVEAMLAEMATRQAARAPRLYIGAGWGGWNRQDHYGHRSLDSVVLRAGQLERVIEDLGEFLSREADYVRLGMPYHRGYLFYGPPGTGKTSVAKAIADHFGMDVYYLPLTVIKSDSTLADILRGVEPRSLLLLEDIDVVHGSRERDDDEGVTLSGLLNALDGFITPHGLITVMTTNRAEVLDPALIRAGRVDVRECFEDLDEDQFWRLVQVLLPNLGPSFVAPRKIVSKPPAEVIECVKHHLGDPDAAWAEIAKLVGV